MYSIGRSIEFLFSLSLVKVREEIKLSHLAKMFLREKIKRQCWSGMTVKGKVVKVWKKIVIQCEL